MNVPKYEHTNFRIWNTFNLSNLSPIESENLKKLAPAPTIPIDQLRAQIASFRQASGILTLIQINLGFTLLEVDQVLVSYYFL